MAFQVRQEARPNSIGRDPAVWVLEGPAGARLEVWPALGFNAYSWVVGGEEILFRDPAFFDEVRPTRSGWPILFPFPNRIRDGRFSWNGKIFELPRQDPSGKNAIHGFVVRRLWRIVDQGADREQAWVSAEFDAERDAADVIDLWPALYQLNITYRLSDAALRIEATVTNPGGEPLPFGLGYHPYFRVAPFGGGDALVGIDAEKQWKLIDNLPAGATVSFRWAHHEQRFNKVQLDDLLTDLPLCRQDARSCGSIESESGRRLVVEASRDFRELVVFTPPHRQAICFEPYTCITDAINLEQQGIDAGLRVLQPGESWQGWVQVAVGDDPESAA